MKKNYLSHLLFGLVFSIIFSACSSSSTVAQEATISESNITSTADIATQSSVFDQNKTSKVLSTSGVPLIAKSKGEIAENAAVNTIVGSVTIVNDGGSSITSFTISGAGSGYFKIDKKGVVKLKTKNKIDYEKEKSYTLTAIAKNKNGMSQPAEFSIEIKDVKENTAPFLGDTNMTLIPNAPSKTILGIVTVVDNGGGAISAFTISGSNSKLFTIDKTGTLRLKTKIKPNVLLPDPIVLGVVAKNKYGTSKSVSITIATATIQKIAPQLADSNMSLPENTPNLTLVGKINIVNGGNSPISKILLTGEGSENFEVAIDGTVSLGQNAILDFATHPNYNLKAIATNNAGGSNVGNIHIEITKKIDISFKVKTNMHFSGGVKTTGKLFSLASRENLLYLADGITGLQVVNMNGGTVSKRGVYNTKGTATDIVLSKDGTKAFVADNGMGLQIIDITLPDSLKLLGGFDTDGNAYAVALSSDEQTAYIADNRAGLQIIDISSPTTPQLIGNYNTPDAANGVAISKDNKIAYVADTATGLQIIDISNPASPVLIKALKMGSSARDVVLSADETKAFVATSTAGLQIVDISTPNAALIIGTLNTNGYAHGLALSKDEKNIFLADGVMGLLMIDVSEPVTPVLVNSWSMSGTTSSVHLGENNIYTANGPDGLQTIDATKETLHASKNFVDGVIELSIHSSEAVSLGVSISTDRDDIISIGNYSNELNFDEYNNRVVAIPMSSYGDMSGNTIVTITLVYGYTTETKTLNVNVH